MTLRSQVGTGVYVSYTFPDIFAGLEPGLSVWKDASVLKFEKD